MDNYTELIAIYHELHQHSALSRSLMQRLGDAIAHTGDEQGAAPRETSSRASPAATVSMQETNHQSHIDKVAEANAVSYAALGNTIKEMQAKIDEQAAQIYLLQESQRDYDELRSELKHAQDLLSDAHEALDDANVDIARKDDEFRLERQDAANWYTQLRETQALLATAQQAEQPLQHELNRERDRHAIIVRRNKEDIERLQGGLESSRIHHLAQMERQADANAALSRELADAQANALGRANEVAMLSRQLVNAQAHVAAVSAENAELRRQVVNAQAHATIVSAENAELRRQGPAASSPQYTPVNVRRARSAPYSRSGSPFLPVAQPPYAASSQADGRQSPEDRAYDPTSPAGTIVSPVYDPAEPAEPADILSNRYPPSSPSGNASGSMPTSSDSKKRRSPWGSDDDEAPSAQRRRRE